MTRGRDRRHLRPPEAARPTAVRAKRVPALDVEHAAGLRARVSVRDPGAEHLEQPELDPPVSADELCGRRARVSPEVPTSRDRLQLRFLAENLLDCAVQAARTRRSCARTRVRRHVRRRGNGW